MRKRFTRILAALALLVFMTPSLVGWGQTKDDPTVLFLETFGSTSSNTAYPSYNGYSAQTTMFTDGLAVNTHYTGEGKVGKSTVNASTTYTGASGNSGAWHTGAASTTVNMLVIDKIKITGYTSIQLSFGAFMTNGATSSNSLTVKYKIDDGTEQTMTLSNIPSSINTWSLATGSVSGTGTNLKLTFIHATTAGYTYRLDDIKVTGTVAAPSEPTITIEDDITELAVPNYVVATPANYISYETFTVNGSNLEGDVNLALNENSNFQMSTDLETWTNTISLTPTDGSVSETVAVRLKAVLSVYEYSGQITLTSTNADPKSIDLSGSVTYAHVTYDGNSDGVTNVPTDNTDYSYNQQVTVLGAGEMTKEGYEFLAWDTKSDGTGTTYEGGDTFNITADTTLYAQWEARSYNITKADMTNGDVTVMVGENVVTSATTGATVSLVVTPATDYVLSELTVAKTGDATTTVEVNNNQFIMPPYAVTVTATFVEHVAVFTNGVYSEPLTSQESFDNMQVVSTEGDETWVFNSTYNSSFITSEYDEIDWLITPKMVVENGKLNISFQIYHKNYDGQLSLKWSASNDVLNGEWHSLTFSEGSQSGWRDVNGIVIETEEPYVYVAFVYDNTADEYAGQYQIRNFVAKQYYNVTFNANIANASGSMSPLSCLTNTATPLTANVFTAQGKAFTGWNTQADGDGTTYADGANITITQDTTLYAQWVDVYTVSFTTNGHADGTKTVISGEAIGTLPTPTADFIPTGYDFTGWYNGNLDVNGSLDAPVYIASDYEPTADVTLRAVFAQVTTPAGPETWTKITDLSTVTEGTYALITQTNYAFDGSISDGKGGLTLNAFSFENNVAQSAPNGTCELTYISCETGFKMYDANNSRYLYAKAAKTKNLAWHDEENSYWYYDSDDENWEYESNNARLRSYDNTNFNTYGNDTGAAIYMAKKTPGTPAVYGNYYTFSGTITTITENTSRMTDIPMNEFVTVTNGATLTLSGNNLGTAENLIIEDGGQLIFHDNGSKDPVLATVKKDISAATNWETESNGWNFIASPLSSNTTTPASVANMITADIEEAHTYDLYRYDGSKPKYYWENYRNKEHTDGFNLVNGQGYLYANQSDVTLEFAGTIQPSDEKEITGLNSGYNLVGNPFTCNARLNVSYYKLNATGDVISSVSVDESNPIAPCTGVIIYGPSVTFTPTTDAAVLSSGKGNVEMVLAQTVATRNGENTTTLDNAIVSFNEGSKLGKFYFGTQNANIYIPMDNEEFAIVSSNGQGEMPVNFRAYVAGEYTITVNPEEVEMGYLHLIDNIAGKDVDLLANPSYSFNARTDDYESRFRLVFSTTMVNAEMGENFAFMSDGQLVIANEGEATLQVIDVTGRVVATESINGTCSKAVNAKAGVYVLRLINGTDVKTQKMVIR